MTKVPVRHNRERPRATDGPLDTSFDAALGRVAPAPEPPQLTDTEREALLEVARKALAHATGRVPGSDVDRAIAAADDVGRPASVFVTLTEHGELRGCMGSLDSDLPLAETVASAAITVVGHDPRFLPVSPRELPSIRVEVSVLSEPVPMPDASVFRRGIDGVIVLRSGRRALLLPEVAVDQGWDAEEMLDAACRKAGLERDAWQDPSTVVLRFASVRFGGPAIPDR